jgi:nucleoside phosphorylase
MGRTPEGEMRTEQMQTPVVVFTALAWESAAVRSVLRQVRQEGERVWRGLAGSIEIMVVTGGIGPRRTQRVLEQFVDVPFAAVLSIGCAGALIPGLATGQLILSPEVYMHSAEGGRGLQRFPVDAQLLVQAQHAAAKAGISIAEGSLFTSARVLFTPEEKTQRGQETGAIAVEMESGVHAAFAASRGLPFLALRVILDGVDMRLPAVRGLTTPEGDVRALRAALYVATHPHHLSSLLALKQTRTIASQALARLCHALFPLLDLPF